MRKSRIYHLLGLSATISTATASILSLLFYIYTGGMDLLVYAVIWALISLLDYILWRRGPGGGQMDRETCGLLRESAELVAMLVYLMKNRDEYGVAWRIDSLLARVDPMKEAIHRTCGASCLDEFDSFLNEPTEERASSLVRSLHECMVSNGCESNVVLEEK